MHKKFILFILIFVSLIVVLAILNLLLSRNHELEIEFEYYKNNYKIKLDNLDNFDHFFDSVSRKYSYYGELPENWKEEYYSIFLNTNEDAHIWEQILKQISKEVKNEKEIVPLLVAFVQQGIKYDWRSYYSIEKEVKFPVETLLGQKGVCTDKSLLLIKLLCYLQFDVVLFEFNDADHVAVGIKVPREYGNFNSEYAYVETTSLFRIGEIPESDEFQGGSLVNPELIQVGCGDKVFRHIAQLRTNEEVFINKYGEEYFHMPNEGKLLIESLHRDRVSIDSLKNLLETNNCEGEVEESVYDICIEVTNLLNEIIARHNHNVDRYNKLVQEQKSGRR